MLCCARTPQELVCGTPTTDPSDLAYVPGNNCHPDRIASPDNVAYIPEHDMVGDERAYGHTCCILSTLRVHTRKLRAWDEQLQHALCTAECLLCACGFCAASHLFSCPAPGPHLCNAQNVFVACESLHARRSS